MKNLDPADMPDSSKSTQLYVGIGNSFLRSTSDSRHSCVKLYSDMRVDELKLLCVWLSSQHLLTTAKYVMDGHKLKTLGIVDEGEFVGVLRRESLVDLDETELVAARVEKPVVTIQSHTKIEEAAELFVTHDIDSAPVLQGEQFLGIVTSNMLLRELRQSRDPLTGLPWSDRLREWGIERLREGKEITIVFLDLDDFGIYNKRFGHVIGDRVLQFFSEFLKRQVMAEEEVLVRFGGDEFAICTCRTQHDVLALLKQLGNSIQEGQSDQVHFSVGVSGGRRTIERENIHFAATIDNLINLASRDCQRNKRPKTTAVVAIQPEMMTPIAKNVNQDLRVVSVHDIKKPVGGLTTVIVTTGDAVYSGVYSRTTESIHHAVALATCQAIQRITVDCQMVIDEVFHEEREDGERYVTVAGHTRCGELEVGVSSVEPVEDDVQLAIAKATVAAFMSSGLATL